MEIKELKQIVDLIKRSGLTEFQLEKKDFKLRICRKGNEYQSLYPAATPMPFPPSAMAPQPPPSATAGQRNGVAETLADKKIAEGKLIRSPMVGTFYSAPSPDRPAFVSVSDSVSEETVVCIVEAMKVMNEIQAETKGIIAEILVQDGESVEYGQPLFRLK